MCAPTTTSQAPEKNMPVTNKNFANMDLPWMADRLGSFTDLLSDLEVLEKKGETISLGKNAEEFIDTLF